MRSLSIILTAMALMVFGQVAFATAPSEGSAEYASQIGTWGRSKVTIVEKSMDHEKVKSLVNDLLGEAPVADSEEKSFRQSESSK